MKKLKLLIRGKAHRILLLSFLLVLNNKLKAQIYDCKIDNYLMPFNASLHSGRFPRGGPLKKDFIKLSNLKKEINVDGNKRSILLEQYRLNRKIFINMGKTKVKNDSVFYLNISKRGVGTYYHIKKPCSIKLIGYKIYNSGELQSYFKLSSENCKIIFSIQIFKSDISMDQYDSLR